MKFLESSDEQREYIKPHLPPTITEILNVTAWLRHKRWSEEGI